MNYSPNQTIGQVNLIDFPSIFILINAHNHKVAILPAMFMSHMAHRALGGSNYVDCEYLIKSLPPAQMLQGERARSTVIQCRSVL